MGRPPRPMEERRRNGRAPGRDSGGRKLPEPATVIALPMAAAGDVPDAPDDLQLAGLELWRQIWETGQRWISPGSDRAAVELACRLADDLELTREIYRLARDMSTGRLIVSMSKELGAALSRLGFDPTSRSRLGVAEVKAASALDEMLARRAKR